VGHLKYHSNVTRIPIYERTWPVLVMSTDPLNETGFLEIWPVSVMCTICFLECDSKTRIRGTNPKKPGTKKAFGFYSVLVSPVLYIAGDFVMK
jgi:hypothetical protein